MVAKKRIGECSPGSQQSKPRLTSAQPPARAGLLVIGAPSPFRDDFGFGRHDAPLLGAARVRPGTHGETDFGTVTDRTRLSARIPFCLQDVIRTYVLRNAARIYQSEGMATSSTHFKPRSMRTVKHPCGTHRRCSASDISCRRKCYPRQNHRTRHD